MGKIGKEWESLNTKLMIASEWECDLMLSSEKRGLARKVYLLRIHARFNKLRAERERKDLAIEALGR